MARLKQRAYQKRATKFLMDRGAAALFLDPGLGKTSIVLEAIRRMKKEGLIRRTLVIAPRLVCHAVWPVEVQEWDQFNDLNVVVLHGKEKDKRLEEDADIYVINPAGLKWLLDAEAVGQKWRRRWKLNKSKLNQLKVDTLVIDELSNFKNHGTQRFGIMKQLIGDFDRRWALTGTPAPRGLANLYSQIYLLDGGYSLGRYPTHFRAKYFVQVEDNKLFVPKPDAEEKIREKLKPLALRMEAQDYLELPPFTEVNIRFDLPPKCMKAYRDVEKKFLARLDDDEYITAANTAAAGVKCRQLASGAVYLEEDETRKRTTKKGERPWKEIHREKLELLVDLIGELQGQQLLIAYEFDHDLKRIQDALDEPAPVIGKGTTETQAVEILERWNQGNIPILLAHPASAGHGLNAQKSGAGHIVWFTTTWDFELYDQFVRRLWRQGSKAERIVCHRLVARDTVEERVIKVLDRKRRDQSSLLNGLREYAAQRKAKR